MVLELTTPADQESPGPPPTEPVRCPEIRVLERRKKEEKKKNKKLFFLYTPEEVLRLVFLFSLISWNISSSIIYLFSSTTHPPFLSYPPRPPPPRVLVLECADVPELDLFSEWLF